MTAEDLAARLPDIATVRAWSQSLAALDAVLDPDPAYRWFSFDAGWGADEQVASMRNGSGDEYSITFSPAGAYLRGFDHESLLSPFTRTPAAPYPGLLDAVPAALRAAALEPAWQLDGVPLVTVSLWRLAGDAGWHAARARDAAGDDGSEWLFDQLDGDPASYAAFAAEHYETEVDLAVAEHVLAHRPLTADLARALDPDADWPSLVEDLAGIGYPTQQRVGEG